MSSAIEELEKLAKDIDERDDSVYEWEPDQHAFAATLTAIATRLRTEERDGKREAFVAGAEAKNIDGWPLRLSEAQADSERRWP